MINMYTKQEIIIQHYRLGKSQRQISRELGISRRTVKRYVEEHERLQHVNTPLISTDLLSASLSKPPIYSPRVGLKRKLTQEIADFIDGYLVENETKNATGFGKQCLKKIDIFELVQAHNLGVSYSTVCNYIRDQSQKITTKEAFIRQVYEPGSVCEFDWGEIKLCINGTIGRYYLAVFTSAYSNYRYALLFQRQDTLAFMESHTLFFKHVGGAFHQMTYDNMRVAVSRFVGLHEKEPTRALLDLRAHYFFTHRFCNIYSGNEKGHVERGV